RNGFLQVFFPGIGLCSGGLSEQSRYWLYKAGCDVAATQHATRHFPGLRWQTGVNSRFLKLARGLQYMLA
ncbi:MAG TPA: hypothetical protein PKC25_06050, partial [Candidatus Rifleibacterium sp.]|nr:hypothetical protein [Candidatus Rifleibacterium sp.]